MKKYHAYIKGNELLADDYCETQWVLINRGMDTEYLGLSEPDDYHPLSREEWSRYGINEDNADFVEVEELEE